MAEAISISELGKRYRLGEIGGRPTRITEALGETSRRLLMRARRPERQDRREIWALHDVSLEIAEGEAVGIIGRNGSGKSTLLKILARITEPTRGRATINGRVGALIEIGTDFHPELTGRENVFLNGAILGMSRSEIRSKFDAIAAFSEIEEFLDTPVKRYSSGMKIRLAFSVAAHLEPEILLIDEVLAVGDAEFQRRCLGRMDEISKGGRTVLFVSHNSSAIENLCDRAVWLDRGTVQRDGPASEVVVAYLRRRAKLETPVWRPRLPPDDVDLRCHEIRLVDRNGGGAAAFRRDEPVVVEFDVEVLRENSRLRVGFDLANQEGMIAFATTHADGTAPGEALLPGRYVLRAEIPPALLNVGLYSLHARIHLTQVRWIVHEDDVLQIEVEADDDEYQLGQRPGLVAPTLPWTHERVGARVRST
jgi:lipopolysaccharide transport system ATP-binding protein